MRKAFLTSIFVFLLTFAGGHLAHAAAALVQQTSEYTSDGSLAYSSNVTSGNLLAVFVSWVGVETPTITDTRSNSWSSSTLSYLGGNDGNIGLKVFYTIANSTGANTISIGGTPPDLGIYLYEFSGINTSNPLDTTALTEDAGVNATTPTTDSFNTNYRDLIIAAWATETTAQTTIQAGSGYTLGQSQVAHAAAQEYKIANAGSHTASFTLNPGATSWVIGVVAFREATTAPTQITSKPIFFSRSRSFVFDPLFQSIVGQSTSTSFYQRAAGGQVSTGISTSTSYTDKAGQLYFIEDQSNSNPAGIPYLTGYRWFANSSTTATGQTLADLNATTTAPAQGTGFRLRAILHTAATSLGIGSPTSTPSTAENNAGVGSIAWTNPTYVSSSNDVRATATFSSSGETTNYLYSYGYGFSVPSSSVILGVSADVEKSNDTALSAVFDDEVRLVVSGVINGNNYATTTNWLTTDTTVTYGTGTTDLWGYTIRPDHVNANNFGLALSADSSAGCIAGCTARVDKMTLRVYYRDENLKLQVAERSGTCDVNFSGETYVDVATSTGAIRFFDNSGIAHGDAITASSSDPTHGGDGVIDQIYVEQNRFYATSTVQVGNDGLWDFALVDNSATGGTTYCFRVADANNASATPDYVPEITTAAGGGGGGITVSGTVYSAEGTTTTSTVAISVNGGAKQTVSTDGSGVYTFSSSVTDPGVGGGVTVWMDNGGAGNGSGATFMRYSGSGNITGLNIHRGYLRLRSDDSNPVASADLSLCDKTAGTGCTDIDLHFEQIDDSTLVVDGDWGLFIEAGTVFTPGSPVTLMGASSAASSGGDLVWGSSASSFQPGSNAVSIGGDWRNDVAGLTTLTSATTTFTATSSGFVINTGNRNFGSVVFDGLNGVWSASTSNFTIATNRALVMTEGTLDTSNGSAPITLNNADVIGTNGVINLTATGHRFVIFTSAGQVIDFGATNADWNFVNLTFSVSGASGSTFNSRATATTTITFTEYFAIGTSTNTQPVTFNAGAGTYILAGDKNAPLTIQGPIASADLVPETSTFIFTSAPTGGNVQIRGETYYNLEVNNSTETFTPNGAATTTNDMVVTAGTFDTNSVTLSVGNDFNVATSATLLADSTVRVGGDIRFLGTITFTDAALRHYLQNAEALFAVGSNPVTLDNVYFNNVSSTALVITANSSSSRVLASSSVMIGGPEGSATTTLTTTAPFDIELDLTIATSGVLIASSTVQFNIGQFMLINQPAQFISASSTFVFDTQLSPISSLQATISGNPERGYSGPNPSGLFDIATFNNLTFTTDAGSKTPRIQRGARIRVEGLLKLAGVNSSNLLALKSSDDGEQWAINHQGTESLSYASVQSAACDPSSTNIHANKTVTDVGNNGTCWRFQDFDVLLDSTSASGLTLSPSVTNEWTATTTTDITVTSVSPSGYKVYAIASDLLRVGAGDSTIPFWTGTNAVPTTWTSTCYAANECGFGYTTNDTTDLTQFSSTKFAGFTTSSAPGDLVAQNLTADGTDVNTITYRLSISPGQAAGTYNNVIYYTTVQEF